MTAKHEKATIDYQDDGTDGSGADDTTHHDVLFDPRLNITSHAKHSIPVAPECFSIRPEKLES